MMEMLSPFFHLLVFPGGLFALAFGLLLKGVDRKVVARLQRRVGPPLHQPFIDLVKLLRKDSLVPETAQRQAFQWAPLLGFTGVALAVMLIPISGVYENGDAFGDLLVLLYLLVLPALALMIGGSASSNPFGSIGFSREMSIMLAYEGPLLLVLLSVALKVGAATGKTVTFSLTEIVRFQQANGPLLFDYTMLPAFLAYLLFIPANLGVAPFDIPEAESEILEGPLLEYSGPALAMFNLMSALKMVVILGLGVTLFFPAGVGGGALINLLWFAFKCLLLMLLAVTLVRTATGRLRIDQAFSFYFKWPEALGAASLIMVLIGI
ncbi:NADH-quinone oxidoreductase subunit H [Geothermobacter ehrlichii]|uniref:NADH-quinone oxidoreductase subunit H n=1 Tax=Geothermobacter ehrlichii TaxID=213224 RepID=A0A5D3WKG9_9BACT|nr:complex I subunit 1 family protein [Geothermobacter ehrlichii]TYO98573.1 NADH-quinone oxidoreductase subunit H [Geothermobacter ehrlichii]